MCLSTISLCVLCRCLGPQRSFIELDCSKISQKEIDDLEVLVNESIRAQTSVIPHVLQVGSPELEEVRNVFCIFVEW